MSDTARTTLERCALTTMDQKETTVSDVHSTAARERRQEFIALYGCTGGTLESRSVNPKTKRSMRILVGNIRYDVIEHSTRVQEIAAGRPHLAAEMEKYGIRARLVLRRANGRRLFSAYEYDDGRVGRLVKVA